MISKLTDVSRGESISKENAKIYAHLYTLINMYCVCMCVHITWTMCIFVNK